MALAAATLLIASAIHFGLRVPLGAVVIADPFPGAAVPELVLGILLGAGVLLRFAGWRHSRVAAIAVAAITLLGTVYGMTVTLRGARTGDIAYHLALLLMLLVTLVLLWRVPSEQESPNAGRV